MKKTMMLVALFATLWCLPVYGQSEEVSHEEVTVENQNYATVENFGELFKNGNIVPVKKYTTTAVNIRQEPNTDAAILGTSKVNTEVEVVLELDGWSMITTEGGYAYMKSDWFSDEPVKEGSKVYLGVFRITHYCPCRKCNGKWAGGPTESGKMPHTNHTIAVDKRQIPLGSEVVINGQHYIAEDTGSGIKSNCIDIFVGSHQEALNKGVYYTDVYLIN